jgi:[CysO sulfur-carrier protein]-S-L-cysteine hydrolase
MRISRSLYDEMVAHAQADAPNECCGMVAARDGDAVKVYPAQNTAASPLKFVIDPRELFETYTAIENEGLDFGAIYHSHTRTDPYPSQTDINFAKGWPGVQWLILGLAGSEPTARIYEIRDGEVVEHPVQVE